MRTWTAVQLVAVVISSCARTPPPSAATPGDSVLNSDGGSTERPTFAVPDASRADGSGTGCTCEGLECGCGGECGTCPDAAPYCDGGTCSQACAPSCVGLECGDDGCGGQCGSCPAAAPQCVGGFCTASCTPSCDPQACGQDGCGGSCGECPVGESCQGGQCVLGCQPSCVGSACGDDGCGGDCGGCMDGFACEDGACQPTCSPSCAGSDCGSDGCGGDCGACAKGSCVDGLCEDPDCADPADGCLCAATLCGGAENELPSVLLCALVDGHPDCAEAMLTDTLLNGCANSCDGGPIPFTGQQVLCTAPVCEQAVADVDGLLDLCDACAGPAP